MRRSSSKYRQSLTQVIFFLVFDCSLKFSLNPKWTTVRFRISHFQQYSERPSWPSMVTKLVNKIFRRVYIALPAFLPNIVLMCPKVRKRDLQIKKIERSFSVFQVFVWGHFIPLVSRLGQSGSSIISKRWNVVRSTRRAKIWRKVRSQCGEVTRHRRTSRENLCTSSPAQEFKN